MMEPLTRLETGLLGRAYVMVQSRSARLNIKLLLVPHDSRRSMANLIFAPSRHSLFHMAGKRLHDLPFSVTSFSPIVVSILVAQWTSFGCKSAI